MNKAELINAVAEKADVSKKDAEAVISATLETITAALKEGDKVQLVGFGSFEVKKRAARMGRNPKTKARVQGRQGPQGQRGSVRPQRRIWQAAGTRVPAAFLPEKGGFSMRLDKYLKVSRLIKRRTVANEACDNGLISVNGKAARASYEVKVGDQISLRFGQRTLTVEVLSVQETVKQSDAGTLYREIAQE